MAPAPSFALRKASGTGAIARLIRQGWAWNGFIVVEIAAVPPIIKESWKKQYRAAARKGGKLKPTRSRATPH